MKYTVSIEILKSVDEVVRLFDNAENLNKWMHGLQSFEHLSGEQGQPGAQSRLKFKEGKREIEMVETIKVRNLPEEFSATYEAKGVVNYSINRFRSIEEGKTEYISEQEFVLKGALKLMGIFMPGAFKKQTLKYMQAFKAFAESTEL